MKGGGRDGTIRGEGEITIKREIWEYLEKREEIGSMKGGGGTELQRGEDWKKTNNNEQFRPDTQNNKTNLSRMDK